MGLFNILDPVFSIMFGWMLPISLFLAIALVSLLVSIISTIITKYATNQKVMKQLREELNAYQNEAKSLRNDPSKAMAVQSKAMEVNMKYMMESFRATFFTFIPIIIIFGWMSAHLAYQSIMPGEQFAVTGYFASNAAGNATMTAPAGLNITGSAGQEITKGRADWNLSGAPGDYIVEIEHDSMIYNKAVKVTDAQYNYEPVLKTKKTLIDYLYSSGDDYLPKDGKAVQIKISNRPVRPFGDNFNLFGWHPGWLATYLICTIIMTQYLRKLLKVY
jgi:uncharacterized membrane protein (DUF106 family)